MSPRTLVGPFSPPVSSPSLKAPPLWLAILAVGFCLLHPTAAPAPAPLEHPAIRLGLARFETAATTAALPVVLKVMIDPERLVREAYEVEVAAEGNPAREVHVTGGDTTGAMYGLFELAEMLRDCGSGSAGALRSSRGEPHESFRAIKFNLPWDAYRSNEAITVHMETCRDLSFWEDFLNMMAENRFNALTLWNLHPFPYMIRPTHHPEACPFSESELAEWQNFFRTVFRLARERGIETYIVNWNIFISPALAEAHGIPMRANVSVQRGASPEAAALAKRYNRECVTQVLNEYPDLTGIGLSLGEAMGNMTAEERQQWILETLVAGLQAADRPARLIHRVPFSAGLSNGGTTSRATEELTRAALEGISGVEGPILVEAKFNWSHAHSTPKLVKVHGGSLSETYWNPPPTNYRMVWMMRNEDFFFLRWGEPDFIREVLARNSGPHVAGYFIGSECYVPALDYFTRNTTRRPWKWAFERQWLFYQTWGRLLYDPATPDTVFSRAFRERYGQAGEPLFDACRLASRVPLRLTSSIDINNDKSFYAEGFLARDREDSSEFLNLDLMLRKPTLDPDYLSAMDYARMLRENQPIPPEKVTPIALARLLDSECGAVLSLLGGLPEGGEAQRQETTDLKAWAQLGLYFADKLRAAVDLARFRLGGDEAFQAKARRHIERAIRHWEELALATTPVYREVPLTHLHLHEDNHWHWSKALDWVRNDLEIIDRAHRDPVANPQPQTGNEPATAPLE